MRLIERFFAASLIKFSNTRAQMLDSIYHLTLNYFKITFLRETTKIFLYNMRRNYGRH